MAHSVTLSNGTTTVTLTADILSQGNSFDFQAGGRQRGRSRTLAIRARQIGTSHDTMWQAINTIERLLTEAATFRSRGLGRRVTLTVQMDGASLATVWDVLGGELADRPDPFAPMPVLRYRYEWFTLILDVEPFGRSTESTVFSTGTLYGVNAGLTHRYVYDDSTTNFSVNMASVVTGSLFLTTKFSTSPTELTAAANDILYFGNSLATFDRLIMGISTAASGITWGNWQYWDGSTWSTLTTATNSFKTSVEFDTTARLGAITWSLPGDWATTSVNSVTAYWVRLSVSSVSSPVAPVLTNGPVRSLVGIKAVASTDVLGDVAAKARVHLTTASATALAGARAALAEGVLTSQPPPFVVEAQGITASDEFITSGDSTAAVATDAAASLGERVEVSLAASISDRAQTLNGSSTYITLTPGAADKLGTLGAASFFVEVVFKADTVPSTPVCLASQWSGTLSTSSWWLGIDQGKLRLVVSNSSNDRKVANGSTTIEAGTWYMATLEFDAANKKLRLYRNSSLESETNSGNPALESGQTTAIRIGRSVGFATGDSRSGSDSEGYFDGAIGHVFIYGGTIQNFRDNVLSGRDYNFPDGDPPGDVDEVARSDSASVRWLLQMNDNAASTAIVDTAATYAAAQNAARSAGNSADNTTVGILQGGAATSQRILGIKLPQCLGEEYAGTYRVFLAAAPAADLTSVNDVEFALQFSVGDAALGFQSQGKKFPSIVSPSGYYLLDMGPVTLPPVGLYEGHRGSGSASNMLLCNVYIQHAFTTSTVIRLDCLYFLPTSAFVGTYDTFRVESSTGYSTAYALAQGKGVAWDNRALEPLVYQTATAGASVQARNPYADYTLGHPRVQPRTPAWLFAVALRPDSTNDVLYRVTASGDTLTPRLDVVPQFRALAAPAS